MIFINKEENKRKNTKKKMENEVKKSIIKVIEKANNEGLNTTDLWNVVEIIEYLYNLLQEKNDVEAIELYCALKAILITENK